MSPAVTLKIRSVSVLCYVPIICQWKFGKNLTTGPQDIMQTRKYNTEANGIYTNINIPLTH